MFVGVCLQYLCGMVLICRVCSMLVCVCLCEMCAMYSVCMVSGVNLGKVCTQ